MRHALAGLVLATILATAPLAAQRPAPMPPQAANLVVQVLATSSEDEEVGAGIVVAASNRIIIVTAAHVVRTAAQGAKVRVVFQFARGDTLAAQVDKVDKEIDLAVLSVQNDRYYRAQFGFDRRGDASRLEPGSLVVPLGCPERRCWEPPVSGDRVISASSRRVRFESFFVSPGSSGGALFNREWEIVGIVTEKTSQDGLAVGLDEVADRLTKWGYALMLAPTKIPREGYGTRVSLIGLAPTTGGINQSGRAPSGRLALNFRGRERIGWHVAALRLAPTDIEVLGGMIGASVSLRTGRFTAAPFGEVGMARLRGRYNVGSYFVQGATGTVAVPIWDRVTKDVAGIGGGADLEYLVLPHLAITGVVAHWSFRTDSRLPSIPNVFAGAGLKLAF